MVLRGGAFWFYVVCGFGMAVFFGLEILDDELAALDLTEAWRVVASIVIAGLLLALALALHHRARRDR